MRINGYSYPRKIVLSSASITLQEWQIKYPPFSLFHSFPVNEETGSATALSETRNLNESFLKKRQSNKTRRGKVCYYGAPLTNWREQIDFLWRTSTGAIYSIPC
ncbi:hypothetical protein CEXT_809661 [Caerostris extrusa]|uniref:Uncharacterized protein n=1 Tax=Caerostris extrusa TaxID=172846 RepID=A0AAV4MC12_CAEEX|nr:hypothetical protein CEXT_809661 [Caerostris extrusa]